MFTIDDHETIVSEQPAYIIKHKKMKKQSQIKAESHHVSNHVMGYKYGVFSDMSSYFATLFCWKPALGERA